MNKRFSHFTSYTGDVKDKVRNLPLGPLTAIVGDEATYKSALAAGIRLALTGVYEPVGKLPGDLAQLAADPELGITTIVSGPDGSATWSLRLSKDGKPKRPESPQFDGALASLTPEERANIIPTDSVRDLLKNARGDRKLREAFLRRFGAALTDVPTPQLLEEEAESVWRSAVGVVKGRLSAEASGDTLLADVSEYFRKESGAKRREITPLEASIRTRKAWLTKATMEDGLAVERLPELQAAIQKHRDYLALEEDRSRLERQGIELSSVQTEINLRATEEKHRQADFEQAEHYTEQDVHNTKTMQASALAHVIDAQKRLASAEVNVDVYSRFEAEKKAQCPYCSSPFSSLDQITATKQLFEKREAERLEKLHAAEEAYKAAERAHQESCSLLADIRFKGAQETRAAELEIQHLTRKKTDLEASIKLLKAKIGRLVEEPKGPPLQDLEAEASKILAVVDAKTTLLKETAKIRELEHEYDLLKKLEGEAIELQKSLMVRVAKKASEEVSRGMPGGRSARLDPQTCEWYVRRGDGQEYGPFGVLCGTEKTALILGLVAAWTRESPLRVAIFDDEDMVGLSTKGLCDFRDRCQELQQAGDFTQVILVSNRPDLWIDDEDEPLPGTEAWTLVVRKASPVL